VLVTQALLYEELLRVQGTRPSGTAFDADRAAAIGDRAQEKLDWLGETSGDETSRQDVNDAILVAQRFLKDKTVRLQGLLPSGSGS